MSRLLTAVRKGAWTEARARWDTAYDATRTSPQRGPMLLTAVCHRLGEGDSHPEEGLALLDHLLATGIAREPVPPKRAHADLFSRMHWPLRQAVQSNRWDCVQRLLDAGCSPQYVHVSDDDFPTHDRYDTVLHIAARQGHVALLDDLLSRNLLPIDTELSGVLHHDGFTPVMAAAPLPSAGCSPAPAGARCARGGLGRWR